MDARFYLETERSKRESPIVEMGENCVALEFYLEKSDLYIQGIKWRTVIYMLVGLSFLNTKPDPLRVLWPNQSGLQTPNPQTHSSGAKLPSPELEFARLRLCN